MKSTADYVQNNNEETLAQFSLDFYQVPPLLKGQLFTGMYEHL